MIRTACKHFIQILLPLLPSGRIAVRPKLPGNIFYPRSSNERGFSILELITSLGIIGIMSGMALYNIQSLERPLPTSAAQLAGFFKQVRAKAIATTSAYTVSATGPNQVIASFAASCGTASPTQDMKLIYNLPTEVALLDTTWSVCFNPRGLATSNISIFIQGENYSSRQIEVFLGGAVRVSS